MKRTKKEALRILRDFTVKFVIPLVLVWEVADRVVNDDVRQNVIFVLGIAMLLSLMSAMLLLAAAYRSFRDFKEKKRMHEYILHLELFSMVMGTIIVPEGTDPTSEKEVKRFQKWRMN